MRVTERRRLRVTGVVQGVGFRPFVARLASDLGLVGQVGNDESAVFIEIEGPGDQVAEFGRRLIAQGPPLARVDALESTAMTIRNEGRFDIVGSEHAGGARTLVPPDSAVCAECLGELDDPSDRRYRHPFITCTNCGPRFTIINNLPYDRPRTTLAGFTMCGRCRAEYESPLDRRFHAQPISCHDCGPTMWLEQGSRMLHGDAGVLAEAQCLLAGGAIVAIKGIGGFHLACDATNAEAVGLLRERKQRPDKPFAVMAANLDIVREYAHTDAEAEAEAQLTSPAHPIVLLPARRTLPGVADGLAEVGVMLPYSPLHHLLFRPVPGQLGPVPRLLVMTSGNVADEPLCFDNDEARARLDDIADAFVMHDRPIAVPCDDSVVWADGTPVRRSRGYAPLPLSIPCGAEAPDVLAVGAELKNTFCLLRGDRAFVSGHLGDMGGLASRRAFEAAVDRFTRLNAVEPAIVVADEHPGYSTRQWAETHAASRGLPLITVQHHHAHAVSLLADHGRIGEPLVAITFDGTGYGCDAHVWGGEVLVVGEDVGRFTRVAHLREFPLAGGDAAVRNPWRIALALLRTAGIGSAEWQTDDISETERRAVQSQLAADVGCVETSSAGRLLDGVAALLGVRSRIGYEAQAAIESEVLARSATHAHDHALSFGATHDGIIDWVPAVQQLMRGLDAGVARADLALGFHLALAEAAATTAIAIAEQNGIELIGLTGGVFANRVLSAAITSRIATAGGHTVLVHDQVPCNDGGLSLGQAIIGRAWANGAWGEQHG